MTKYSIVLIVVLVACVIGGYVVYHQRSINDNDATQTTITVDTVEKTDSVNQQADPEETILGTEIVDAPLINYDGTHIMPNGTVMTKDGTVIIGATIRADGKIQMPDGTLVTPAMDMRTTGIKRDIVTNTPAHEIKNITGVDYAYDIKQIKVKKGDTVTINFKSEDGFHDWVIDEFTAATARVTEKDGIASVTFVADKIGTFQYYCSVMSHRQMGMVGYLTVEER